PPRSTLFPYTSLFRSRAKQDRKRSCSNNRPERDGDSKKSHHALVLDIHVRRATAHAISARSGFARRHPHLSGGGAVQRFTFAARSEEHTSELQSPCNL